MDEELDIINGMRFYGDSLIEEVLGEEAVEKLEEEGGESGPRVVDVTVI